MTNTQENKKFDCNCGRAQGIAHWHSPSCAIFGHQQNQEKNVLTDITPERLAELEKAGVKVAKTENQERECENGHRGTGIGFEEGCPECEAPWKNQESWEKEFDKEWRRSTYNQTEQSEAVREYYKSFIRQTLSNQKSSLVESLAEMTKDKMDESLRQDILALLKRD